jgi:hypothetical protein
MSGGILQVFVTAGPQPTANEVALAEAERERCMQRVQAEQDEMELEDPGEEMEADEQANDQEMIVVHADAS